MSTKALAALVKALAPERTVPAFMAKAILSALAKGKAHKYLRRVPIPGKVTKTGKQRYRYFYRTIGGSGLGHHDEMKVGAAFRMKDGGEHGHFEVTHDHGDGHVTVRHDETGTEHKIHKDALATMLHREHAEARKEDDAKVAEKREKAKKQALADLEEAKKHGASEKTIAAAKKRAADAGHVEQGAEGARASFEKVYAKHIKRTQPGLSDEEVSKRAKSMTDAASRGAAGIDGPAMRATAKELGVKFGVASIADHISGGEFRRRRDEARKEKEREVARRKSPEAQEEARAKRDKALESARQKRSDTHLEKEVRFKGQQMTRAEMVGALHEAGYRPADRNGGPVALAPDGSHFYALSGAESARFSKLHGESQASRDDESGEPDEVVSSLFRRGGTTTPKADESKARPSSVSDATVDKVKKAVEAAKELPDKPVHPHKDHTPKEADVKRLTTFASKDSTRPNLAGVHADGKFAYATDGHRAVIVPTTDFAASEHSFDTKSLQALIDAAKEHHKTNKVAKSIPPQILFTHTADGGFHASLRTHADHEHQAPDDLKVHAKTHKAAKDGGDWMAGSDKGQIAVNAKYLQDALVGHKGPVTLRVSHGGQYGPLDLHRTDGERHIIMPMRI